MGTPGTPTPPDPSTIDGLVLLLQRAIGSLEAATERQRLLADRIEALELSILAAAAAPPPAQGG